ncbi:MAG TPA: helix-turn-helix transcriptional regulator [Syntrophales bacterium]|nr:helix-turn-helix transcriptional regulator [Syntrophales bacterium]
MTNWDEYKEQVRATDPEAAKIIDETEMLSPIIGEMIIRRKELGMNQRDLSEKCGFPQSTIARMESGAVTPKMETLIKVCRELGLKLTVERVAR